MSRVRDALRRAGQLEEHEDAASSADDMPFISGDMPFISGDDSPVDPVVDESPSVEIDAPRGGLVLQRERAIPLEAVRAETSEDVRIADVVGLLYRRRWLIIGAVAAFAVTAGIYNYRATRLYDARARLLVEASSPELVPFRPVVENPGGFDYFMTQLEVIRSRAVARSTLDQLHLLNVDPVRQSAQINDLLGRLTVSAVPSITGPTRVVNVTVESSNPVMAARLANGVAQTYVDQNLTARRQGSRDASQSLTQHLTELRQAMETSERALQRYREQKGSVSLGEQQNIVVQKLAQLSAAVTTARTTRVEKQAVYQQLKEIQNSGAPLDTFSPILANSFIQGLKADLATLQRERRQLGEQLGDLHPDMIKVNTAIANAERRLKEEMTKVVEGIDNDYRAAEANERGLAGALEDQKLEVLKLNQQSAEYGALQRDAASTQQMYEAVRQRVRETQITGEVQSNNAKVLDPAEIPAAPVWPRTQLNMLVALLGGVFVGLALAFGVEYQHPRIAKPSDIADVLGLPLLGITPRVGGLKNRPAALHALSPAYEEALRSIRTRIFLSPIAADTRSIAVTSTKSAEGKTTVASKLAVSMAAAGRRVLLIDADLRNPQLHRIFDLPRSPGFSDVMSGDAKPSEVLMETQTTGLFVLVAGTNVASPTDLLDSDRLLQLIKGFSQVFDVILLDTPPMLAVADASIIANAASSVVFVVGCGDTSRKAARVAIDRLSTVRARLVGVVLNNVKVDPSSEYGYSYLVRSVERTPAAAKKGFAEHV